MMLTEDVEIIKERITYFKGIFPEFDLISDHYLVDDPDFVEYLDGTTMFDMKEVEMRFQDYNHFWALARFVTMIKHEIAL